MTSKKPWGGRFAQSTNAFVERFTNSLDFDIRLGEVDALCSKAHAQTLLDAGIIDADENKSIQSGLDTIISEIQNDTFDWNIELEDVHMNIEARLTELIGDAGRKLHTARSRNDQVAAAFKYLLVQTCDEIEHEVRHLQQRLLLKAKEHVDTIMPGFTHLQNAQPITFGHHLMAWFEMFDRDRSRLNSVRDRTNVSPMGSAALAGTSFPIDREIFKEKMQFSSITRNSLDAVSDRDYAIELVACLSILMVHLSRCCEEVILWMSPAFGFIDLPDELCTGSSIMPQKKNPDVAELIRGKSGRVIGSLNSLLTTMKGQPLAYNRDNQEDKEAVFDAIDTARDCIHGMTLLVDGLHANIERMREHASKGHPTATDMADWLVRHNVPFRLAHEICGKAVALAESKSCELADLTIEELCSISDKFDESVFSCLTLEGSVNSRSHRGGTAPPTVLSEIIKQRAHLLKI